ncbi:hypothetical protein Mrose_01618 [Calidithermus roseus]|uniref:Uncharacterized protein n=1 Tax=Calidithermus roseus TaxID=1644118 RepID=A0A399EWX2_9DEIN|nr:hypothetical protein Mrose_01618 [Calidithermus roseus]
MRQLVLVSLLIAGIGLAQPLTIRHDAGEATIPRKPEWVLKQTRVPLFHYEFDLQEPQGGASTAPARTWVGEMGKGVKP